MEKHGDKALYSAVKSLMNSIQTAGHDAQEHAAHWMIRIAKCWTIIRQLESKLTNGKPLVSISTQDAHLVDLEWTEEEQAKLNTVAER